MIVARQALVFLVAGSLGYAGAASGQALSAGDPPGRVGRLAFLEGTVSFHDSDRTDWVPAIVNTPITAGDAIWTEPKAHSEISIAGTRVRLDGATQLDMLALDDTQTRMQLDQGRVDIKTFSYDARQPYELVTPRGVVALQQQGDYYVEAGSTQDPTRLGVRQGAAQFQTPNGQVLAVRAGQVAEITGDGNAIELHTIQAPPPPMPTYWAQRDRVVVYEQPPQYLSASVTGYEDLNYYGSWTNDPEYGQVWYARSVPQGWAPYTTGRWISDPMYGWTWVDEQPWGFAPYHYGRWAQRNNRWFWVPPERSQRALYAPALVAFVGGTELGIALGVQNRQPVGWFPLGPREAYVPSYTSNRDYYRRLNLTARVQDRALDDRWERAQRREAFQQTMMNRRFTTVVPSDDFARSRPVSGVALRVAPERLTSLPVAAVAAPPQPNQSIRALQAPGSDRDGRGRDDRNDRADRPNDRDGRPGDGRPGMAGVAAGAAGLAGAAALMAIKPEPERQRAPGPQIATRPAATAPTADQKPALPQLAPRNASAPPPPQIQGDRRPANTQPGSQQAIAPADRPATPGQPGAATPPPSPPQANAPATRPGDSDRARPGEPPRPGQATLPPVRDRNDQRPEPPRPGEPPRSPQATTTPGAQQAAPQPPRPGEPPRSPQATTTPGAQQAAPQPPRPGEPPRSPQAQTPPTAQQATPQPQRPGEPPKPPQAQNAPATPQPQRQAEPPRPPQAQTPPRPPQQAAPPPRQAEPPKPQQATPPAPPPQQQIQRQPMPQHQPAPPPQQVQAPRPQPAPPPQQVQAPRPQPAPPPQQVQAPRPQPAPAPPPQAQAPRPQPAPPPQQAQAPRPQPAPPQQQAQPKPTQPQQQQGQQKQDDKK